MKFTAGAFLYNVTGRRACEDAMVKACAVTGPTSEIDSGKYNQSWGVAAYLMCARNQVQPVHYPKLVEDMKAAIVNEAMNKNVANATNTAILHCLPALDFTVEHRWIGTEELAAAGGLDRLAGVGGLWIAPASPYRSGGQ